MLSRKIKGKLVYQIENAISRGIRGEWVVFVELDLGQVLPFLQKDVSNSIL